MGRPPPGTMVWWRYTAGPKNWRFGYCTYERGHDLVRMGSYNGDTFGGVVVSVGDIEWKSRSVG